VGGFLKAIAGHIARRGILASCSRIARILRDEGLRGVRTRTQFVRRRLRSTAKQAEVSLAANPLSVVPVYLQALEQRASSPGLLADLSGLKVAVHLHLFHVEMLAEFAGYLSRIPMPFDLYVSVPEGASEAAICDDLNRQIPNAQQVRVEAVPNRGRDIAPLIVQFGRRLADYDIVGHFHTKRTPHNAYLAGWRHDILDLLLGSDEDGLQVARMFQLLRADAKVVYPEGQNYYIKDKSGWSANRALAGRILETHTSLSIDNFPEIDFPEGAMFWAKAPALREFLLLPLTYDDFPQEPIPADGTLAHALERLILVFASLHPGRCIRLHKHDSVRDYRFYEEQEDYSGTLQDNTVRVLSYYLPQFHPIPENDLWHGSGFTEWTKVRAADPLFLGHYQQHIPHADIGYYLLESPDVLRQQAAIMHKAGVHGQVFYHYWFSGKLILERPARMLLEHPDIDMPFCFCWANENWTRRWDGNEDDILLKQTYSAEDARAFIRYLIPFFRDPRHLTVDGRPVLFVYRPTNIPDVAEYLEAWEAECAAAGLKKPFVAAVLTRGAVDPSDFGMDAGVERVLHDWTNGNVADIADEQVPYGSLENARVLPYADVARYYRQKAAPKPFTYFRSLVPNWDNSARYGAAGYMLHGSTPELFQEWLEEAIAYTRETLPPDRQFVLVNAWNEWAEGAHLEPDSRYGYAYLNAVGRALSGVRYDDTLNLTRPLPAGEPVQLRLTASLLESLSSNPNLLRAFKFCLGQSTALARLRAEPEVAQFLGVAEQGSGTETQSRFLLEFRKPALFDKDAIEKMLGLANATSSSFVVANAYGHPDNLIQITDNGSTHACSAYGAPLALLTSNVGQDGLRNVRVRTDAHCFVSGIETRDDLPEVTTIIRLHARGDLTILRNALFCLAAMRGCKVTPLIAAQDLSNAQAGTLDAILRDIPWMPGVVPIVRRYQSGAQSDLRSVMLNRSLQEVTTRYAAFLDFDDRLLPHAYDWLLTRLRTTGKAIAIGRVFETIYDIRTQMLTARSKTYQYGYSYDDFLVANVAPIHSFMLDLSQLNVANLQYFEDQIYLEDYLMLLQLVRRSNTDWKGLGEDVYVGDYIRFSDSRNTLALADPARGEAIRQSSAFRSCESRINNLKLSLKV